jgi:N-glycosylase/DNA lyase
VPAGLRPLSPVVVRELLDGGQAFRWYRLPDDTWVGTWSNHVVRVRERADAALEWSAPADRADAADAVRRYFGGDTDFAAAADALPWRSDPHLAHCLQTFPALRLLRQPFGETLLCFLCSATKQIVQIKQMVALLAERHGRRLLPEAATAALGLPRASAFQLPTWATLATIPDADLRSCLLGFRARYIRETAQFLAANPGWLEATEALPYPAAKERLCSLPGVGEKVADCVLLFGAGRLEAFPVDVWILKTMALRYNLDDWKPAQVAQFGRVHFGAFAGYAQQFLFAWERHLARTGRPPR